MIAVLDHTFLRIEIIAPFVKRDNGKTKKISPHVKTVILVNTITNMDVNRNLIAKFAMQEKNLVRKKQNVLAAPEVNLVICTHTTMHVDKHYVHLVLLEKHRMEKRMHVNDRHGNYQKIVNEKYNTLMIKVL